ncbi:MAG: hypothetical protein U0625_12700 [Phycisphaerales bacterium]
MRIDHRLLVPQTLNHFSEHPNLRETLLRTVEDAQACNRRFPHTLLTGLPDSGKRSLARTIASEFAAPVTAVDVSIFHDSMDLHEVFRRAAHRSFVILNGIELLGAHGWSSLCQAVARVPLVAPASPEPARSAGTVAPLERVPEWWQYCNFTLIATTRQELPTDSPLFNWIERSYYLTRSIDAEAIRIRRATLRLGLQLSDGAIALAADTALRARIRTLQMVALLAEWMRSQRLHGLEASQLEDFLGAHIDHLIRFSSAAELGEAPLLKRGTPLPCSVRWASPLQAGDPRI